MSEVPLYLSLPLCFALSSIHFVHKHPQPQEVCKPECIIATNTSGLPVRKIAEHAERPENIVGKPPCNNLGANQCLF